jgi:hypothetical protein
LYIIYKDGRRAGKTRKQGEKKSDERPELEGIFSEKSHETGQLNAATTTSERGELNAPTQPPKVANSKHPANLSSVTTGSTSTIGLGDTVTAANAWQPKQWEKQNK